MTNEGPRSTAGPRATKRFIICLGFANTPTNEAYPRTLYTPNGPHSLMPRELIPVREHLDSGGFEIVGTIYDVWIMGNMIQGIGYLRADTAADHVRIEALRKGEILAEVDVSGGRMIENEFGAEFYGWHVDSVVLGTNPCWILPPAHVWEG